VTIIALGTAFVAGALILLLGSGGPPACPGLACPPTETPTATPTGHIHIHKYTPKDNPSGEDGPEAGPAGVPA